MSWSSAKPNCACAKDINSDIEKKCEIKGDEEFLADQKHRNKRRKAKGKKVYRERHKTWKDTSCKKLLIDYETKPETLEEKIKEIEEELLDIKVDLPNAKEVADKFLEELDCFGGTSPLGRFACNLISISDSIDGIIDKMGTLTRNKETVKRRVSHIIDLTDRVGDYKSKVEDLVKYKDCGQSVGLTKKQCDEKIKKIKKDTYNAMNKAVEADPCLKAKRCKLQEYKPESDIVKYKSKKGINSPKDTLFGLHKKGGCCPGQRAHHVVPQTKFDRKRSKKELEALREKYGEEYNKDTTCTNYTKKMHDNAPTVCVEGGHSSGTHGKMHDATDKQTKKAVNSNKPHTLDATLEDSAKAFEKTFSQCKKECIKQQLEKYYNGKGLEKCLKARGARNKTGQPIKKTDDVIRGDEL